MKEDLSELNGSHERCKKHVLEVEAQLATEKEARVDTDTSLRDARATVLDAEDRCSIQEDRCQRWEEEATVAVKAKGVLERERDDAKEDARQIRQSLQTLDSRCASLDGEGKWFKWFKFQWFYSIF